jgi:hypothetical protein
MHGTNIKLFAFDVYEEQQIKVLFAHCSAVTENP